MCIYIYIYIYIYRERERERCTSLSLCIYIYIYIYTYTYIDCATPKCVLACPPHALIPVSVKQKHFSGEEGAWEYQLKSHLIRGWGAVYAAVLQGEGPRKRSVFP